MFMTLMAAFRVLLQRYSAQDDVLIGSPVTGREMGSTSEMIGCLVNNVAFRNSLSANESFADILIRERDAVLNGLPHAQVPFERVVEAIQPHRQFGQHPLFQVLFLFEDAYQRSLSGGGIDFGLQTLNTSRNSYWDLECSVSDVGEGGPIKGYIGYAAELFDADFAEAISGHFIHLLRGIVNDPQQPVGRIGLTDPVRSRQWQEVRHANERHWPGPQTLHARFVEQAALTPDVVALYTDDGSLTYDQLARRSEWLASQLNRQGIGAGDLVGIGAGRSVELIVAIVATLRAGAAYVPLDPGYPALRLQHMVANSGVRMILADAKLPRSVNGTLETIRLDQVDWSAAKDTEADSQELRVDVTGGDRAYVLYTSGSTGLPKGAVGLHRGAVNRCEWMWEAYGFTHQDIFCLRTSPNFVDSVWEIFGPLTHGAALRIIKDDDVADPESLLKHLAAPVVSDGGSISHVVVVPSLLEALLDHDDRLGQQLPRLKTWITSGEPLSPELLQRFRTACPDTLLLNTYGTSEIWDATCFDTNDWETGDARVPIGFPIANVRTYVLDEYLEPVTPGVTGELYVAGAGLGSGYWQQPELTAEKFVADPFVDVEGARMYRTGDLARIRSDGCIECLGRVDRQIKLRGFRVEPDEIAAVLREHCTVNRAFVALAKQKNLAEEADVAPVMVAYWEPADSMPPDQVNKNDQQLRAFLKTRLPAYMVPAVLMAVDPLPLTPNGKVDAQALSALELPEHSSVVAALPLVLPEGETENAVASIWCDVLGIEQCSVQADFFDSGGHSLSATRFLARLRSHFDIDFGLAQFFDAPTIAEVAGHVDVLCEQQHTASVHVIATPGQQSRPDRIPLSFGQERLWFLNELDAGSPAYNIAFTIRFTDRPDLIVLQAAVQHIVQRHEMLRTRFDSVGGKPVQVVMPELSLPVRQASLGDQSAASWQKHLAELAAQPFDLEQGPLLHLHLLSGAGAEHALLVVIHHMISDGLSNAVLFEELAIVYEALADGREPSLPPLPAQYADFALWQRSDTQLREHEK
ncbi:MAG: amino acid adenylation domain-containing protein, partial [Gammaproteobacteria bacterium]|nr:amino acid adenylation domain-containing protein [Gammaproteobacteria bacterium]